MKEENPFRVVHCAVCHEKSFYKYLFMYAVRPQSDAYRKRLHVDRAVQLWLLLFGENETLLREWTAYVQQTRRNEEGITRDEWNMTYALLKQKSLNEDAWPLLIRGFLTLYWIC